MLQTQRQTFFFLVKERKTLAKFILVETINDAMQDGKGSHPFENENIVKDKTILCAITYQGMICVLL